MEFLDHVPSIIEALAYIVAGASIIAAITPTTKDDSVVAKIKVVVDFLALNFGKKKEGTKK